jgi:S-adenosylhomocysteine hydrolase
MRHAVRLTNHFAPIVQATVSVHPDIVLHDGADLIAFLAQFGAPTASIRHRADDCRVQRLRSIEVAGALPFPVVALNDPPLNRSSNHTAKPYIIEGEFPRPASSGRGITVHFLRAFGPY